MVIASVPVVPDPGCSVAANEPVARFPTRLRMVMEPTGLPVPLVQFLDVPVRTTVIVPPPDPPIGYVLPAVIVVPGVIVMESVSVLAENANTLPVPSAAMVAAFQLVPAIIADTLLPLLFAGAGVKPAGNGMSNVPLVTTLVPVVVVKD